MNKVVSPARASLGRAVRSVIGFQRRQIAMWERVYTLPPGTARSRPIRHPAQQRIKKDRTPATAAPTS